MPCDRLLLQAQHREGHGRAVGPRPPSRVRRWRRVGMADRQSLVEEGHDHLLRFGRELLEERRRVRVGRLEQDLGRGAHTVRGLRRQGLRLEALRDVEEDLVGLLADGRVLPGEWMLVSLLNVGKRALSWRFGAELDQAIYAPRCEAWLGHGPQQPKLWCAHWTGHPLTCQSIQPGKHMHMERPPRRSSRAGC